MFSASRVVACLAGYFPMDYSAPTRKEIEIADAFRRVLQDAAHADIDFEEEEEDLQVGLDEVEDVEWTPEDDIDGGDFVDPHQKTVTCDGHPITASMLTLQSVYTLEENVCESEVNRNCWSQFLRNDTSL